MGNNIATGVKEMVWEVDWKVLGSAQWVAFVLNPIVFVQDVGVLKFHAVVRAVDFFFYRTAQYLRVCQHDTSYMSPFWRLEFWGGFQIFGRFV